MVDVISMIWNWVDKFHNFFSSPQGVKLLNIAFISSVFFLFLLSLAFLLRQEFLILLSCLISLASGGIIYLLSLYSSPLPDQYSPVDKFLIFTGAKHVSDPELHITIGAGDDRESAFISALDSAFSTAIGSSAEGLFKNIISREYAGFEKGYKKLFKITREQKNGQKEVVEVEWTLPAVRSFIIRHGFSPTPAFAVIELLKNPTSVPAQTLIDQIMVLYKTKSMYFKGGAFYATCEAMLKELKKMSFKTSAGVITFGDLYYQEKTDAENQRICNFQVSSIILDQGG